METYFCFLLVYSSFIQASLCYFVSNSTGKWTEEKSGCKMATPVINYKTFELPVTINKAFDNPDIWVGYYEQMAMFDYIGCIKSKNVQLNPVELGVWTPGRCYSACSYTKLIGLEKSKCYCFDAKPDGNIQEDGCISCCDDNTSCGGNDYISLYMKITDDKELVHSGENYKCLRIYVAKDYKDYTWKNCTSRLWSSCTSGSSVTVVDTSMAWNNAAKNCFHRKMFPTRYQNIRYMNVRRNNYSHYSWTGVVRSGVIYKEIELVNTTSNILYGFINRDDSHRYILNFSHTDVKKLSLCEISTVTSPATTADLSKTPEYRLTTSKNNRSDSKRSTTKGLDTSLIAGVSSSAVVFLVSIITILFLVIRRKFPSICKREVAARELDQRSAESTINQTSHENITYDRIEIDDNRKASSFADRHYANPDNVLKHHVYIQDCKIDDSTYDTSGIERKTKEMMNDNIYNKLTPENDNTYNQAGSITKYGWLVNDATYDFTENAMKPTAKTDKYSDRLDEKDDNTYNHINCTELQTTKTENVYCEHVLTTNDQRDIDVSQDDDLNN